MYRKRFFYWYLPLLLIIYSSQVMVQILQTFSFILNFTFFAFSIFMCHFLWFWSCKLILFLWIFFLNYMVFLKNQPSTLQFTSYFIFLSTSLSLYILYILYIYTNNKYIYIYIYTNMYIYIYIYIYLFFNILI